MSKADAELSQDIFNDLRLAVAALPLLETAGIPVRLWEAYCLAASDPPFFRRESRRMAATKPPEVSPDFLERLRVLRHETGPIIDRLRRFLPFAAGPWGSERQEMILGFVAMSPPAREAATRWATDPARYEREAADKLRVIERIVEPYQTAVHAKPREEAPAPPPLPAAPAIPEGLTALAGHGHVALAWAASDRASGYVVRRATSPEGPWTTVASLSTTSHVDAIVTNGSTYFYSVVAVNRGGESGPSAPAGGTPTAPLAPPTGLSISPGNGRISLDWPPTPGASSYVVRRAGHSAGPWVVIARPTETSFVDSGLTNGETLFYTVSSANGGGESPTSPPVGAFPVAPPAAPPALAAAAGPARVSLSWNAVEGAGRYRVKRASTPDGPFAEIAAPQGPSYVDIAVTRGATYWYAVAAVNAGGESPPTPPVSAAPIAPPAAPSGLAAVAGNGQVSLSWTAVPGAVSYSVKRADGPGLPPLSIATPPGPSHVDADLENGRAYFYAVSAVNEGGESSDSAPATATPLSAPDAPTALAAVPGNARVALSWNAVPGAAGYVVKRAAEPGGPYTVLTQCSDPACEDGRVTNGATYYYVVSATNVGGESPDSLPADARPVAPPEVPTGLTCTPGNGRIQLAWTASAGAARYIVKRSFDRRGPFHAIGTVEGTSHVDKDLANGTACYYVVAAVNAGGESPRSSRAGAVPMAPPPAPSGLVALGGNGVVTLTWEPSEGARGYRVRRSLDRRGPYTPLAVTAETRHEDRSVANGTLYHYIVVAFNTGGASPHSGRAAATPGGPPTAPPDLAASPGNARVSLLWTAVPGAASYRVFRSALPDGAWTRIAEPEEPAYVDASAENGRRYAYAVRAANAIGEGPESPRVEALPQGPPPIPTNATASPSDSRVTLLWEPSPGAACYAVKRATSSAGPYVPVANPTEPAYTDTEVENGATYFYRVRAVSSSGESPDTPPIPATPAPVSDAFASVAASPRPTEGTGGGAAVAVLAPVRDREEAERVPIPGLTGTSSSGVDLERLLDLRRVDRLRSIFEVTAQKIETWEALCVIAAEGHDARRELERLVRLDESGGSADFNEGAAAFFGRILKVRSEVAGLVREARGYFGTLGLRPHDREALEIALGFLVSAPRGRERARMWLDHPDDHRRQATVYMDHALTIADSYIKALRQR